MYVRRAIRPALMLRFAWKNLLVFTCWASVVAGGYAALLAQGLDVRLPFLPLSTIGIAVAFYLGFKNSQSYDRFWEARKAWGGIINQSRVWASQVCSFLPDHPAAGAPNKTEPHAIRQQLVYRQLAWANALREQLRRTSLYATHHVGRWVTSHAPSPTHTADATEPQTARFLAFAEYQGVSGKANPAAQLLHAQALAVQQLLTVGEFDDFRRLDLLHTVKECYALQGVCERIKNTPFPRQYAHFSTVFTWIFVVLLPLGLVGEFAKLGAGTWLMVPFSVLISWIFTTIESVGDNSEDPFENYINDVPMTALCRSLEIDLREMLGETELPPRLQPINDILL
ncbi:bestrophin family protein [Hymenobacter negativus]|uniref:Bestrophin n=1 Tax=Hymenobacter negativus TaxID=2795026 RepID=A0ABS3QKF5_9BACT|nr:bestrophin family ion channel [Hymenobacter negativus]MBO2011244.1 hypothetical protein [Hymenobacter negativus]